MASHLKSMGFCAATAGLLAVALACGLPDAPTPISRLPDAIAAPPPAGLAIDARIAGCPTAAEIAGVADAFPFFELDAREGPLVCTAAAGSADLNAFQKRAYFGLIFMKELRFDTPWPWTDKTLYEWFIGETDAVRFYGSDGTSRLTGRIPHIFLGDSVPSRVLDWRSVEQLVGLLAHEARHVAVLPHLCEGTKDLRRDDLGAFGIHNYVLTWIAEHSDPAQIPMEHRPYAAAKACAQFNAVFCEEKPRNCE